MNRLLCFCAICSLCHCASATTTILHDGDNLLAAVAAAANGDVIEIQSNQFFGGTLTWSNKYLTIRAGSGFAPSIGDIRNIRGSSQAGGEFRGLNITGTIFDSGNSNTATKLDFYNNNIQGLIDLNGGGLSTQAQFVGNTIHAIEIGTTGNTSFVTEFRQNRILGGIFLGGTGSQKINATFVQNDMQAVSIQGTGDLFVDGRFEQNQVHGKFFNSLTGQARYNLVLRQNEFDGAVLLPGAETTKLHASVVEGNLFHDRVSVGTSTYEKNDVTIIGNRFENSMQLFLGPQAKTKVFAANNVIEAVESTSERQALLLDLYVFQTDSSSDLRFVNNSIVGYDTGVRLIGPDRETLSNFNLSLANTLLYNTDDVDGLLSTEVTTSLISDGTFAGTNGNFGGIPLLGAMHELLTGSIGIDAGNNLAANLPSSDIIGNARIFDGNSDGIAVVDVGAFEFTVPEPSTFWQSFVATIAFVQAVRVRKGQEE